VHDGTSVLLGAVIISGTRGLTASPMNVQAIWYSPRETKKVFQRRTELHMPPPQQNSGDLVAMDPLATPSNVVSTKPSMNDPSTLSTNLSTKQQHTASPPLEPIFISSVDPLPYGKEYWVWRPATLDEDMRNRLRRYLSGAFPDLGEESEVVYMCDILSSYLIHGESGWWLFDNRTTWRGFVAKSWEEAKERVSWYELWLTLPLEKATPEQHGAGFKKEKEGRKPLTKEEIDQVDLVLSMFRRVT